MKTNKQNKQKKSQIKDRAFRPSGKPGPAVTANVPPSPLRLLGIKVDMDAVNRPPDGSQPFTPPDAQPVDLFSRVQTDIAGYPCRFIGMLPNVQYGMVFLVTHPDGRERVLLTDRYGRGLGKGVCGKTVKVDLVTAPTEADFRPELYQHFCKTVSGEIACIFVVNRAGSMFPVVGGIARRDGTYTANVWTERGKFCSDPAGHKDDLVADWKEGSCF